LFFLRDSFTSTKGDAEPSLDDGSSILGGSSDATKNSFRSLRRTFVKKDKKHINYSVVSPSGAGPSTFFSPPLFFLRLHT
jgi:hypothetical protein